MFKYSTETSGSVLQFADMFWCQAQTSGGRGDAKSGGVTKLGWFMWVFTDCDYDTLIVLLSVEGVFCEKFVVAHIWPQQFHNYFR